MGQFLNDMWGQIGIFFGMFFDKDVVSHIIDVAVVAFLIYKLIQLVRETRGEQLVKGFVFLAACYGGALLLNLQMFTRLVTQILQFGIIAMLVIFQPELRRALEQVGRSQFRFFGLFGSPKTLAEEERKNMTRVIDAVSEACVWLKRKKMGALIVFERRSKLADVIATGTLVMAEPTSELLVNLFFDKAPLHDGAVIIRDCKIFAASCILPLSQEEQLASDLGTRHRAAIGMSEDSDAIVVVVSEETGTVSVARDGMLTRNFTAVTLKSTLEALLLPEEEESKIMPNIKNIILPSKRKSKNERIKREKRERSNRRTDGSAKGNKSKQ